MSEKTSKKENNRKRYKKEDHKRFNESCDRYIVSKSNNSSLDQTNSTWDTVLNKRIEQGRVRYQQKNTTIEQQYQKSKVEMAEIEKKTIDIQEKRITAENKLKEKVAQLTVKEKEYIDILDQKDELYKQRISLEMEKQKVEVNKLKILEIENTYSDMGQRYIATKNKKEEKKEQLKATKKEYNKANKKYKAVQTAYNELKNEFEDIKRDKKEKMEQLKAKRKEYNKANKKYAQREREDNELYQRHVFLETENKKIQEKYPVEMEAIEKKSIDTNKRYIAVAKNKKKQKKSESIIK